MTAGEKLTADQAAGATAAGGPATVARDLTLRDLRAAVAAGWDDFRACPAFGLFFAGIYVAAGLFLAVALFRWGAVAWLVPAAAGFPLVAPFIAVGMYEVSRRRADGEPVTWRAVLGALRGRGDNDQILSMGVLVFVGFGFWLMIAHGIFAVFLAASGLGSESLALFATDAGVAMLAVGSLAGAALAFAFFAITVVSLPMLVDRDIDFLTAIFTSLAAVRANLAVLLAWAAMLALVLLVAMLPLFLGLFVAMPVLAHATWHLYRRVAG